MKDADEKFHVGGEVDPPEWVIEAAEGEENVRAFILGWNWHLQQMRDEGKCKEVED